MYFLCIFFSASWEGKLQKNPSCKFWYVFQGSFYAANWLILANFDPNFVIPEINVNQVRKDLACMLGVLACFS